MDFLDTEFVVGTGNSVYALALQLDGKVLAGGTFISYNGQSSTRIVRLEADGTNDTGFIVGDGFDNTVHSLAID